MKKNMLKIFISLFVGIIALFQFSSYLCAEDLQVFKNGRLMSNPANDGDSFFVYSNGKNIHIRLYYVDCPEISANLKNNSAEEQTHYFGFEYSSETVRLGEEARIFVKDVLTQPFTIHTAFEKTLGKSLMGRVYAFVTTADGNDLGYLLVKNGYARVSGKGRKTPRGISEEKMLETLRKVEKSTILKQTKIKTESNSEKIKVKDFHQLVTINTATREELEGIKGIGPVIAGRIIAGRPYERVDELIRVKGIGPKKLKRLRRYLTVIKK
ncbi:MAG: helix-hairpin-helix domain-containing protein [Elusimicrobiales bacterium]|nr:helix-hairpin-helix domain-containing protein [Elusimicrobiales bacterium]